MLCEQHHPYLPKLSETDANIHRAPALRVPADLRKGREVEGLHRQPNWPMVFS